MTLELDKLLQQQLVTIEFDGRIKRQRTIESVDSEIDKRNKVDS
jgi:hypothetical protein